MSSVTACIPSASGTDPLEDNTNLHLAHPEPEVETSSSYTQKKEQLKQVWEEERDDLVWTAVQTAKPPTSTCYSCRKEVLSSPLIYCQDCGPLGIFCLPCFEESHRSPSLHWPEEWEDGCFQPYIHEKTLVLPHQEMCFSRYDRALTVFDQNGK
ncbi:hypothetical protein Bbelb_116850 [Branchiostoma belcheri]|nr:hypothetical protein Bbelb_116850 [Branchiostoma belcheri]